MAENHFGKFFFVLTLAVLAVTTLLFFSYWKLAWLLLFLVAGIACWTRTQALFIFFLANVILSLAWALKRGVLSDTTLAIFLIALLSALGFVATGAALGKKKSGAASREGAKEAKKKGTKSVAVSAAKKKSPTKRASKRVKKGRRTKARRKRS